MKVGHTMKQRPAMGFARQGQGPTYEVCWPASRSLTPLNVNTSALLLLLAPGRPLRPNTSFYHVSPCHSGSIMPRPQTGFLSKS